MRKQSDDVTEAARRRLELVRRELRSAGLEPVAPDNELSDVAEAPPEAPPATPIRPAGRHARPAPGRSARMRRWLEDRLPSTLRGRVALRGRDLGVLAVVVLVGVGLAALVLVRSAGRSTPVAPAPAPTGAASAGALVVPTGQPNGSAPSVTGAVTVDVAGKVRRPGVVTLPAGSRVIDALRRAGGARGHVDLTSLNLARVLADGEQILVGRPPGGLAASAAATPGAPPGGPLVDLNTANQEQLEQLPGVGPVTAQKILAWRAAHRGFSSVDELLEVDGIGEKTLADLAPYVTL